MPRGLLSRWLPKEKVSGLNSSGPNFYPSGTLWPHGEWSFGYGRDEPESGEWHENPLDVSPRAEERITAGGSAGALPLDLSDAPNSHNRSKRGLNGITGYGQQMIKACGFLMGEKWPQHRKTLGTITLPPMSDQARREVVQAWPDLTRELLQWLSRRFERQGLPPVVCSVSEVQPERLTAQNEAYLHWHLLWLNLPGKSGNWAVDPCDLRAWLESVLCRKVPSYPGGFINVDVKRVRGEAARYLAKYMSKGKQQVEEAVEDWGEDCCPSTWWNMTKPARDAVKAATHKGRAAGAILEVTLDHAWSAGIESTYEYIRHIEIEVANRMITVGWRGRFVKDVFERVRATLESADIRRLSKPECVL